MIATLKNYRQSPRKVRLVANLVKGKPVATALTELAFRAKRAAHPIAKLISSALANAESQGKKVDALCIENITVNKGTVLKRWLPRARGRATPLHKHSSHVTVVLSEQQPKQVAGTKKQGKKSTSAGKSGKRVSRT